MSLGEKKRISDVLSMYVSDKSKIQFILDLCSDDMDKAYELLSFDSVSEFTQRIGEYGKSPFINPVFDKYIERESSIDSFITNPVDVVEGALTCPRCRSTKTFTYTKQVRSGDEGTSVFGVCALCLNRWRES